MHQNMKNFYDNQDIKISITLRPENVDTPPNVGLTINHNLLFYGSLAENKSFEINVGLLDSIDLQVILRDKDYNTMSSQAVFIDRLLIDDFDVIPLYTQYATYNNDKNLIESTNFLGYNGIWTLRIDEPFYQWRHKITGQGWLLTP